MTPNDRFNLVFVALAFVFVATLGAIGAWTQTKRYEAEAQTPCSCGAPTTGGEK